MKGYIKKLLRESLLRESNGIFKGITNIPDYDKLMAGKYDELPPKYSNMVADVVNMSPEQYFKYCAQIQGTTYEQQFSYLRKEVVDKIIGLMDNGVKMDMPYLNFVKGETSQEGRHRTKAAMDMGIKSIPVLIIDIRDDEGDSNNSLSSKVGVWDDLSIDKYDNYIVKYNLGELSDADSLLSAIRPDYDVYLLNVILDTYIYRKLYPNLLSTINEIGNGYTEYISRGMDVQQFIDKLPEVYMNKLNVDTDEMSDEEYSNYESLVSEVSNKLTRLAELYILEHNDSVISSIINYDYSTKIASLVIGDNITFDGDYNSAKSMLIKSQVFDDLDLYSVEDSDYYNMSKEFIRKYLDKV